MRKYSFTDRHSKTWARITRKKAQAAYNSGATVLFCPVNLRPDTPYHVETVIEKDRTGESFESMVNAFEYYNCNGEAGHYTAFYA